MLKREYFAFLLAILVLSSCKILHCPEIRVDGRIEGLTEKKKAYISAESFIVMHGIGSKENDYSEKLIRRLNDFKFGKNNYQLEISVYQDGYFKLMQGKTLKEVYETYNNQGDIEALKIVARNITQSEIKENQFYSINWAVAVQKSKDNLVDAEMDNSPFYFGVNKVLKKMVMMRRVSDAFSGSKPEIVTGLYNLMCTIIIDGKMSEKDNLNVISGSFGTQLFLGLLNEIQKFDNSPNFKNEFNVFANKVANEESVSYLENKLTINKNQKLRIYSLTNQLNLMPNNIKTWYSDVNSDSSKLNFKSVQIVAFRNPNDILCYYMPREAAAKFFPSNTELKVINTFYFNWPVRNDVASAHTVVFKSKKLAKIIYYGHTSNWIRGKIRPLN